MTDNQYTEDEKYALGIDQWITGVYEAVSLLKEGKPLTEWHIECLRDAADSLANTFENELDIADSLKEDN